MNKKLLYGGLAVLLVITGILVLKVTTSNKSNTPEVEDEIFEILPEVDASVLVTLAKSKSAANTVVLSVKGLGSKYSTVAYELTYDSEGLIKGVNSGSKPIDVSGQSGFEREVYLGTCSKNVCKPDPGVKKVTVVLEFTDSSGNRSQFSKEFNL